MAEDELISAQAIRHSPAPQISVSVVTYNNAECLPVFLDSLREQQEVTWEALFFDNGSSDATADMLRDANLGEVFVSESNIGYGRAHNQNARRSRGQYLLILNPDLKFPPDVFAELLKHVETHRELAFVGPRILEGADHRPFPPRRFYPGEGMIALESGLKREEIAWLNGCCLVVQRSAFEKIGGFDTDYFLYQAEADLCLRARRAGFRLGYANDAVVYHAQRESQRGLSDYEYSRRIFEGNAVFWRKHYSRDDVRRMMRFQIWMSGALLSMPRLRAAMPLPQHLLSYARLRARRDVCAEILDGDGYAISARIVARQFRLILEWMLQRRFPIDDY